MAFSAIRLALAYGVRASFIVLLLASNVAPVCAENDLPTKPQSCENAINPPLFLDSDELFADSKNDRVVAKGHVAVYYRNYLLVADELVYLRKSKSLDAIGNVHIKEPDGSLINADRFTLSDDFREGFGRTCASIQLGALQRICRASPTTP